MKAREPLFLINFIHSPNERKYFLVPICYTFSLQLVTGFPKPEAMRDFDSNQFFIRFSEELFDYPYWLQDLSHLPLFFLLTWLWLWVSKVEYLQKAFWLNPAFIFCISYGFANEMIQNFIPDRFPSFGDIVMNLLGVILAMLAHAKARKIFKI